VSYGFKMGEAMLAAFLIGGPLAGMLGVQNKMFVGVAVGAVAFVLLSGRGGSLGVR